jgi:hypothetical protein
MTEKRLFVRWRPRGGETQKLPCFHPVFAGHSMRFLVRQGLRERVVRQRETIRSARMMDEQGCSLSTSVTVVARLGITLQSWPYGEKRYVRGKEAGNLRDRWPTVAPPMRDSFGEVACLDSQPHLPPCNSALMRVAAYGFVFFIYEHRFPGSRYMHFDPHNSI